MHLHAAAEFDFGRCQRTIAPTSTMTVAVSALSRGYARPLARMAILRGQCLSPRRRVERAARDVGHREFEGRIPLTFVI
jgi:hypothetical protein